MSEFKVTLARIEAVNEGEQGKQIRAVFHIERDRGPGPFDRRHRSGAPPSEVDDLARTVPQVGRPAGATRRFTPPELINCAGGVKR